MTTDELVTADRPRWPAVLKGELAKALAAARRKCRAAPKDAVNTFHRYRYASAEAILTEAKQALEDTDLALVEVEQTLNEHAKDGEHRYELVSRFVLLHGSGECLPLVRVWPVVPEKGRPLDKATAIAATTSLAYLLRGLLLMPRADPDDDLAGRPDLPVESPQAKPPVEVPRLTEGQHVELSALIRDTGTDVARMLAHYGVKVLGQLTAVQADEALEVLRARKAAREPAAVAPPTNGTAPATPAVPANDEAQRHATMDRIDKLSVELKIQPEDWKTRLTQLFGTDDAGRLTLDQLGQLERRLINAKVAAQPKAG